MQFDQAEDPPEHSALEMSTIFISVHYWAAPRTLDRFVVALSHERQTPT
jgi:hypothetical protein